MFLEELFEAKVSGAHVGSAMNAIISYLEKKMGFKLRKLGVESFSNSSGHGRGIRYVEDGTANCIRFNWVGSKSAEIVSVDIWNGSSRDPQFNIAFKGTSLAKSLPSLVQVLKKPRIGTVPVTAEEEPEQQEQPEEALAEAKKGEFTPASAIADMVKKLEAGRTFNRSEFVMNYHPENAHAYDDWVEEHKDELVIQGKRISLPKGAKIGMAGGSISGGGGSGSLEVSRGGRGEQYETPELDRIEAEDRISFSDSLQHLEGLTTGLIRGSFNALFVAGRGGTGKTQTVEDALAAAGLTDGGGYFKITGSASPIGIYAMLYKHRNGIVLFDDCDGALESQDGRNIIKAATDTKKIRKIAWGKKTSGMYDPDSRPDKDDADADPAEGDDEAIDDIDDDQIPKYFNFTGRVIFISNLPLNKLDPDGALRTRAFVISIDPTPAEIFARMNEIVDDIKLEAGTLSPKERQHVLAVVKTSRRAKDASLRTLVRALNLAASGAPNWEKLVELYA